MGGEGSLELLFHTKELLIPVLQEQMLLPMLCSRSSCGSLCLWELCLPGGCGDAVAMWSQQSISAPIPFQVTLSTVHLL